MSPAPGDRFPPAEPHGPIREIQPDVFVVYGTMRMGPLMRIGRNMVICREGDELTLLNAVRLSAAGEHDLAQLGRVRNVVRLGCFHGLDDPWYVDRCNATFWCQPDSTRYPEPKPQVMLGDDTELPIRGARVVTFRQTRGPECVVLIERDGGLLVSCDSFQHYASWERMSLPARVLVRFLGFRRSTIVGPLWLKYMASAGGDVRADFERILALDFERLIGAHGTLVDRAAHGAAERAVATAFADA